jgi:ligand-binding sensor domain-containing protein
MNKSLVLLLTIAIAQFALIPASYADNTAAASDYPKKIHFRNIMQNQDIALGEVESIIQDYQGFIWLGGRNALLRYDGYEFLPIPAAKDPANVTDTEPVNQVLELLEDKQQTLWAATRSGLYRYDRDHEVLLPVSIPGNLLNEGGAINAIAESLAGDILIGTANGFGILNQVNGNVEVLTLQNGGLPSNLVNDILVEKDNLIWLGLDTGLAQLDLVSRKITLHIPKPENPKSTLENSIRTATTAFIVWIG